MDNLPILVDVTGGVPLPLLRRTLYTRAQSRWTAVLIAAEEDVRMRDMMRMYAPDAPAAPLPATLVLNLDSAVVSRLLAGGYGEGERDVAKHLLSLALLSHRPLSATEMAAFLSESYRFLERLS